MWMLIAGVLLVDVLLGQWFGWCGPLGGTEHQGSQGRIKLEGKSLHSGHNIAKRRSKDSTCSDS